MSVKLLDAVAAAGAGAAQSVIPFNQNLAVVSGGIPATVTLTTTGVFADAQTVTLGTTVYRIKSTPAQAYDVQMGAAGSATLTLDNLKAAVNGTGTPGTEYFAGTLAHPDILASTKTASTLLFVARALGTAGNSLASTETCANASFGGTTLSGGANAATGSTVTIESSGDNGTTWVTELSIAAPTLSPVATTHRVYIPASTQIRANVSTYGAGSVITATLQSWRGPDPRN